MIAPSSMFWLIVDAGLPNMIIIVSGDDDHVQVQRISNLK
jgi:hypothetical protein